MKAERTASQKRLSTLNRTIQQLIAQQKSLRYVFKRETKEQVRLQSAVDSYKSKQGEAERLSASLVTSPTESAKTALVPPAQTPVPNESAPKPTVIDNGSIRQSARGYPQAAPGPHSAARTSRRGLVVLHQELDFFTLAIGGLLLIRWVSSLVRLVGVPFDQQDGLNRPRPTHCVAGASVSSVSSVPSLLFIAPDRPNQPCAFAPLTSNVSPFTSSSPGEVISHGGRGILRYEWLSGP